MPLPVLISVLAPADTASVIVPLKCSVLAAATSTVAPFWRRTFTADAVEVSVTARTVVAPSNTHDPRSTLEPLLASTPPLSVTRATWTSAPSSAVSVPPAFTVIGRPWSGADPNSEFVEERRVPPLLIVMLPVVIRPPLPASTVATYSVPPLTVVAPVNVLVPVSVHTPVPTLVIAAGCTAAETTPSRIVPAKVALVLRPPTL